MNDRHNFISLLAVLAAIVVIVALGVAAVAFDLRNPNAFELFAAAVTGLVAVVTMIASRKGGADE